MWVGFLGFVAGNIFHFPPVIAACALGGIVLLVQTGSPLGQAVAGIRAAKRHKEKAVRPEGSARRLPSYIRPMWLVGSLLIFGLGLFLILMGAMGGHGEAITGGVIAFILSLFCLIMSCRAGFGGWYRYLIKPSILLFCLCAIVGSSMFMGFEGPDDEVFAIAMFLIIFPSIVFLIVAFIPARKVEQSVRTAGQPGTVPAGAASPCKRLWALVLALVPFVPFLPLAGLHRFYVGKIGTGILWLFTGGLLGLGQFIDIILIIAGHFKDKDERRVLVWYETGEGIAPAVPSPVPAAAAQAQRQVETPEPAGQQPQAAAPAPQAVEPQPPSWPSYPTTGTVIYEPWQPLSGLLAAVGHIFALVAILVGLALGLRLPWVLAGGWPDPELTQKLNEFFGYAEWPRLLEQGGVIVVLALLFIAALFIMMGRRKSGPVHLVRAVLGLGGFFWAIQLFRSEAVSRAYADSIVDLLNKSQVGLALEKLFGAFSQEEAVFAGVITLASVLVLAWPPRRRTPVFAPMPEHQGVVS
jgi:hypothetical protein